jgi:signal transduction histidine kinase
MQAHLLEVERKKVTKVNQKLENRVQKRTSQLVKINKELIQEIVDRKRVEKDQRQLEVQLRKSQKMEAIGTLAGGVAHDLNNILSGVVSYPELLLMDVPPESPLRQPLLTIQESGQKAAAIVQDLLTLARRGVSVTEVMNLNQLIDQYLNSPENHKILEYHPGVKVKTNLQPKIFNILGSPVHLSKTIMNLVSNAAEAMPSGGVIHITTENRYIDRPIKGYDTVEEGDYVKLTVSDNGVGISPEDIDQIFEPFYTKKTMGRSGTGLGMAVVWGTVKDHDGYIDVQSELGEGTVFTLYFPITRKKLPAENPEILTDTYMGRGESILVVDDVKQQREIASSMLKKLGYNVLSVPSGEEAVIYLQENTADLLVLDMIMNPGIDGLETYKKILKFHPQQKAIIASGFSESSQVKAAQKMGAGSYLKKPYSFENIGLAVKAELEK